MNEEEYRKRIQEIQDAYSEARSKPGGLVDFFEGFARQPTQALWGAAKAIPAGYKALFEHGTGEGEHPFQEVSRAMSGEMMDTMYQPKNIAEIKGAETSSFIPEMFEKVVKWVADKSADLTGSDAVGAAVYTAPNLAAFPGLFTSIIGRSVANFRRPGPFYGEHAPIDVRAQHGTPLTELMKLATMRSDFGFYGKNVGDRAISLGQSALQTAGSIISLDNPYYSKIMKETGFSPATVRALTHHFNSAIKTNKPKSRRYHEGVMASELRKVLGFRLKEGKPITPQLWDAVKAFHPRMVEVQGAANPSMMTQLLDAEVDPSIMDALVGEFNRVAKFSDLDQNVFTAGANPGRVLSATPRHIDVLVGSGSAVEPISGTMKNIRADKRFNFNSGDYRTDWVKPGQQRIKVDNEWVDLYDTLDPTSLDADYVNRVLAVKRVRQYRKHGYALYREGKKVPLPMKKKGSKMGIDWEAYAAESGQWKRDKSLKNYQANYESKVPKVRDITVNDEPYFIFSTSKRSTDPLLGTMPGVVMINKADGKIHVLSGDELDLFSGKARELLEIGFRKRFWTMFYGQHSMPGTSHATKAKPTKPVDYETPMYDYTRKLITTKPDMGKYLTQRLGPSTAMAVGREEKKRRENRKARNIY